MSRWVPRLPKPARPRDKRQQNCSSTTSRRMWACRRSCASSFPVASSARSAKPNASSTSVRRNDMTEKTFASQADLVEKKVSFDKLSDHAYAYTAEGDPNTGIVVGDEAVMVIDTQATPIMAQDVVRRIREVTDKPIKYVVLS